MTQNKARRTNKIDFLQLPWAQEARGSNPRAPTNLYGITSYRPSLFSLRATAGAAAQLKNIPALEFDHTSGKTQRRDPKIRDG
jgi:hypothetical protein